MPNQLSSVGLDFGILLGLAYQQFVDALNARLREGGFTDLKPSFGYVIRAVDHEPLTATRLASRLHMTPQGAAKLIDELVDRGFIQRLPEQTDKRARRLVLAVRGEQLLTEARAFHQAFEQRFAQRHGLRRAAALRSALEALVAEDDAAIHTARRLLRPL